MADAYDALSAEELRRLAEERGLTIRPGSRRSQILQRIREADAEAVAASPHGDGGGGGAGDDPQLEVSRAKFDLRPDGAPPAWHDIPWGYGETRVTAMARDPEFLYVYWEATDEAIAGARAKLGPGGAGAVFVLRVYDTTFRHFDGTNANAYFDVPVDRAWNSYFLRVDRPRAVFHVDIGMKSHEGYFAMMARSGAAEMPAAGMSDDGRVEWMTVHAGGPAPGPSSYRHRYVPRPAPPWVGRPPGVHSGAAASWSWTSPAGGEGWEINFERVLASLVGGEAAQSGEWYEQLMGGRVVRWIRWTGGRRRFTWRTGPVATTLPAGLLGPIEIWFEGRRHVVRAGGAGASRCEFGPWTIVISGTGLHGERRVIGTWVVRVAWATEGGLERIETPLIYRRILGAFRRRTLFAGGSELLIREEVGASEELLIGSSERLWIGASEMLMAGGSEIFALGASERLRLGASEWSWGGASEWFWGGASEFAFAGASERQWGGASLLGGASERLLAGAGGPVAGLARGEGWIGVAVLPAAGDGSSERPRGVPVAVSDLLSRVVCLPAPARGAEGAPASAGPSELRPGPVRERRGPASIHGLQRDLFTPGNEPLVGGPPEPARPARRGLKMPRKTVQPQPPPPRATTRPADATRGRRSAKRKPVASKRKRADTPDARRVGPARGAAPSRPRKPARRTAKTSRRKR